MKITPKPTLAIVVVLFAIASAAAQQTIKLERFRKALWKVHVTLNGKPGDFLFDTGGGATHVTEEFSKGLDCKFWGRITGYNMFGHKGDGPHCDDLELRAGSVELSRVNVAKLDFKGQFSGDKDPDGLLALDAFDGKAITIDQRAATVTIETTASLARRTSKMTEMPFRIARECSARCLSAFLGVRVNAGMTWLNMDTGAGGVSLIARDHAPLFGLDPDKKGQQLNVEAGPGIVIDGPVMIADMIMDGNLGQPFLSKYVITLDLKNGRCWFAPIAS